LRSLVAGLIAWDLGIEARASTPDATRKMMISDIARWKAVIERAGIERQ
jgi:putative tricarboxylic transport membrane protein